MPKLLSIMVVLGLLLSGCAAPEENMAQEELALQTRTAYLSATALQATVDIHADYGQRTYDFTVALDWQAEGETRITLTAPEEVAGISAIVGEDGVSLVYDGVSLETGDLDAEGLSPVSALPVLLEGLRSGYIAEVGEDIVDETTLLRLCIRDAGLTPGTGRELMIWTNPETGHLVQGEVLSEGRRVIACQVVEMSLTTGTADGIGAT